MHGGFRARPSHVDDTAAVQRHRPRNRRVAAVSSSVVSQKGLVMQDGRPAVLALATLAALAFARPARADNQTSLMYVDPEDQITSVSASTPTGVEHYLYLQEKVDPNGSNVVCRSYVITVYSIELHCYASDLCLHEWADDPTYVVRYVCRARNPPPQGPQMQTDTAGVIGPALRSSQFAIADVSAMPSPANRTVAFGIPAAPRYVLPSAGGGSCPVGTVMISSPQIQSLGSKTVCVETVPLVNNATVESQVEQGLQSVVNDADSANSQFPYIVSILNAGLGSATVGVACRTDDDGGVSFCLRSHGTVDTPQVMSMGRGFCPVQPDEVYRANCQSRGEQSDIGCS